MFLIRYVAKVTRSGAIGLMVGLFASLGLSFHFYPALFLAFPALTIFYRFGCLVFNECRMIPTSEMGFLLAMPVLYFIIGAVLECSVKKISKMPADAKGTMVRILFLIILVLAVTGVFAGLPPM